ncbi:MAG: phosphoglycerate dehydrogenase [Phycisphaerales bacterium]
MTTPPSSGRVALLLEGVHESADPVLAAAGLDVRRVPGSPAPEELIDLAADATYLGIRSRTHVTDAVLRSLPTLEAIGCFCIGTNQVDGAGSAATGRPVFNSPFSNTRSVAELTIAEIIGLARGLVGRTMDMHAGRWHKSVGSSREVRGRTVGIIGYGHIGSQVSVLAEAMGMHVVYHDIVERLPLGNARPVSFDELLASSDFVTVHVPGTERAEGMMNAAAIERMRPGAMLINNARGSVVDVEAVASAVRSGHLGGAAIDVHPDEPSSSSAAFDTPLAGAPNVILTPHIGGSTHEAQAAIARDVATKIARYETAGTTSGAVNVPEVDLPVARADQHRILHWHRNVPGVLSTMHAAVAELGVNINAQHLQSNADVGYVILDVDPAHGPAIDERLANVTETIRVRSLAPAPGRA